MRNSKQRDLILSIINNSYNHLSAFDIYNIAKEEMNNISLGTVYRNLSLLENEGFIRRIKMDDNTDRFDRNDHHTHFICDKCHKIYDSPEIKTDLSIYKDISDYQIIIKGICNKCKKEGK